MMRDLESLRETWDFEAKRAAGKDGNGALPKSFWETFSAMANTHGGCIVLGVGERHDGRLVVEGIEDIERVERELWSLMANPQKISANLLDEKHVWVQEVDGKKMLVVEVPRAPRESRPVYVNGDVWRGTYLRVHESDCHADRERVRRMIAEAEYESRDDRVLPRFHMRDFDPDTLRAYRNVFRSTKPNHPWLPLDDEPFARQLGALRRDRATAEEGLTAAGLLMFGTHKAIREAFPNYFVDYQERGPDTGVIEWVDRVYPDGSWSGNLYDFYRKTIVKLTADLKIPFQLQDGVQRIDETHVHEALREALVNALIHADYDGRVSILVVKRPGGFGFRNPGGLRLPLAQIRAGGISDCRNRTLQQMFLQLGIGEQAGSGFSRILRAWEEQSWRTPLLRDDMNPDKTTLDLPTSSLLPADVVESLGQRFGIQFRRLSADGRMALVTAALEHRVNHERLRELTTSHRRDLTLMLGRLVARGLLEKHGERRDSWYSLPGDTASVPPSREQKSSPQKSSPQKSSPQKSSPQKSSPQKSSPQKSSPQKESSPQKSSPQKESSPQSPVSQHAGLGPLAVRVAASRRAPRQEIIAAILEHCSERFVSLRELAKALNRSHETLQQHYVNKLAAEGRVALRFPDKPNHPEQAYRTAAHPMK